MIKLLGTFNLHERLSGAQTFDDKGYHVIQGLPSADGEKALRFRTNRAFDLPERELVNVCTVNLPQLLDKAEPMLIFGITICAGLSMDIAGSVLHFQ